MAFPRNSLRAFLTHAKKSLFTAIQSSQKVTIVVGNESADLDSLTASVLYSYIRSLAPPSGAFTPLYIPVLNIPDADIRLRPEFSAVFSHANIDASHLVTLDDLLGGNGTAFRPEKTKIILVDHNSLRGELGKDFAAQVQGVVDHHEEEPRIVTDTSPEPRVIEKCGSCTSLVVRTLKPSWESGPGGSSLVSGAAHGQGDTVDNDASVTRNWDAQIAKMALASILVDTANLTAAGKVEQADIDAVRYLEAKINLSPQDAVQWDRTKFYECIDAAKRDIGALSFEDILRKDYKQWTENELNLGMSSVVKPLGFLAEKITGKPSEDKEDQFVTEIGDFMAARSLTIFAIMTTFTSSSGEFQRELYVQALSSGHAAAHRFAEQSKEQLKLEDHAVASLSEKPGSMQPSSEGPWRKIWLQKDISKSRKQVAPLIRRAMNEAI
ncbi:Exopolyphosphatase [Xanthoria calcicola]